jgi:plastocyanin
MFALPLAAAVLAAAGPSGATVSVADMAFTPATVTVVVGSDVTWDFPDSVAHTTTSLQGFWNSGAKSDGETFTRSFGSAGTYPYECTFHPMMRGTVKVPVSRTGSAGAGWTLRWASGRTEGTTYDVQARKGKGHWKTVRSDTAAPSGGFHRSGSWTVRARTHQGSGTSGWSPGVVVKTS